MVFRTPRGWDGTRPTGIKIDEILPQFLAGVKKKMEDPRDAIYEEWILLLGEKIASQTELVSLIDGVLTVIVKSSTLYSLLCQYEKRRLLEALRNKFQIKDLAFRVG